MQLVMHLNASGQLATSEYTPEAMTLSQNWFSRASIHFKRRRQKNAARLIDVVPVWCWAKVPPFLRWKILSSLENGARRSSQKLSATESPQIIFTSRSRILPVLNRDRRWNVLFRARRFLQIKWIPSMHKELPRFLMMQLKGRQTTT